MISYIHKNKSKIIELSLLIIVTIVLRLPIFFLSHNNNDELIHLSLAMKIEKYGLNVFKKQQYNLFYVERGFNPNSLLIGVLEGENKIGSLLEGFLLEREKLSHHPPALPLFLSLSHKIFAKNSIYLVNISNRVYLMAKNFVIQFYACIVPFLFSLFFIFSVYVLGNLFFSQRIGFISAFFLSLTPAELVTANKIWADDMTAFFVVLSVIFYLYVLKDNKPSFSLLSGLFCGVAILTKMSGMYIIFTILLFHIFEHRNDKVNLKNLLILIFDRNILYFLAGVFISSGWWLDLYYSDFSIKGTKLYFAINETYEPAKSWNMYFKISSSRPWFSYFVLVPFQSPLYILSYVFIPIFVLRKKLRMFISLIVKEERYVQFIILWATVAFIFLTLKPGKELRYMLIAYPAISILSVYCLNLFYEWLKNINFGLSLNLLQLFFVSIILASLFFSLKIALPRVLSRADIIPIPF